jgi:hypothetical protein
MRATEISNSLTIFFLFFGIAALEAVRTQNWLHVAFWLVIGVLFVLPGRRARTSSNH